ncbi:MAG: energy transducer TonB [Deltaproteobacteria bacterium]|nr:energy transducer TonB [Deltaproteobacteria bacterium]
MDPEIIKTANNLFVSLGIKKIAFGLSFFLHILFFMIYQPELWETTELKAYKVELIRDVIDDIPIEKLEELEKENSLKKITETDDDSQETISLDTKDKRYISYTKIIKQRLSSNWGYPRKAKERFMEGKSHAVFSLSRNGQLINVSITGTSGHEILDQEGVDTIKRASPFPPFPESISVSRLNINVSFEYRLTSSKK